MNDLPKDVMVYIALNMDLPEILSWCVSSKRININICENKDFWRNKLTRDYNISEIEDPKDTYLKYDQIINTFDKSYAMELAASENNMDLVLRLLSQNIKYNKLRPSLYAIRNNNLEMLKIILGKNISENVAERLSLNAVYHGNVDMLIYLLQFRPIRLPYNSVYIATKKNLGDGNLDMVQYLQLLGYNIHVSGPIVWNGLTHEVSDSALVNASKHGHLDVVKYLIKYGADVNTVGFPLLFASKNGHLDVVKYLIKSGAEVNPRWLIDPAPIVEASKNGHLEIVKYLVENGANPKIKLNKALRMAKKNGHDDIAAYLKSI